MWATVNIGDVMWAETWTGATTKTGADDSATPSANYGNGTTVYNSGSVTYSQSANSVYVRNDNLAGGESAPELMLTSGQTWTISGIPTGGATELTLTYKSNNTKSSVTCSTQGASISGSSKSYTITTGGAATITLVFSCSGNTRIDDVSLTVKSLTLNCATPTFTPAAGLYVGAQSVAIACTTQGSTIRYAIDEAVTGSSTLYESPISVTATKTINALAQATGYEDATASATYTILSAPTPNPANVNSNYYTLVENVNDLADGDAILIVSGSKAMGAQGQYNRAPVDVTVANNAIDNPTGVQKLVLVKSGNYYFFHTGDDGYLCASSSTNNNLLTKTTVDGNSVATISISGDDSPATITFQGAYTRNYIRFNTNFTCYATGSTTGSAVQIFKEVVKPANAKSAAQFSFPKATYYHPTGSAFTTPTLSTANGYDGTVEYSSSVETVATVNPSTGAVTIVGVGTTIITASANETEHFYADNTSYTLNVYEIEDGVFDFAKGDYGTGLEPGDTYYTDDKTWTAGNITLKTTGNYRWYNSVNGTDLRLYGNDPYCTMVVSAPDGYVITKIDGLSSSLTASTGAISSSTWTGKSQSVTFTYENSGNGSITIKSLTIYYSEPTISVTMGSEGYMTYCNVGAALSFDDLEAYIVSAVGADNVTLSPITQAPANTPVVLKGTQGSHDLTVLESASAAGTNKLKVSDGTITTGGNYVDYALAKKGDVVGFYKVQAGVKVPAGKCYIPVYTGSNAPEYLAFSFGGDATGINMVHGSEFKVNGEVYNLNGQRVAQPTKGLYIVNGKKVMFK